MRKIKKIDELDSEKVLKVLTSVPLIFEKLNHKSITGSGFISYIKPNEAEGEFIKDLFTLETKEIVEKWYVEEIGK